MRLDAVKRYCPYCKTLKPMRKAGFDSYRVKRRKQRWQCRNKRCRRMTIHPLKKKK